MVNVPVANYRLKEYILRLQHASLGELVYRLKQILLVFRLKRMLGKYRVPPVPKINRKDIRKLKIPAFDGSVPEDLVRRILEGKYFALNTDQKSIKDFGTENRSTFFSKIKPTGTGVDIRAVWEPGRLQHLTILMFYYFQNPSTPDADEIHRFLKEEVLKWIDENPFLFGPNYMSVMECGLRVPVLFYCLQTLTDLPDRKFHLILETIYLHGWWISKRLSLYSSLGNHTICECVGLIFAGAIYRNTLDGKKWLKQGSKLLQQELKHQILDDGGPAEQSLAYHRFVLDLYWLAFDFIKKNHLYNCCELKPRLEQGENFLNAFQDNQANVPSIGDSDDGFALAPGLLPRKSFNNLAQEKIRCFRESGYTTIHTSNNVTLSFDHGPLGMAPLYNHGHADALSITLSKQGIPFIVDSGTFRYNGVPRWRKYFKGTRAHNTVTIDSLDQAVQETGFIWSRSYQSKILLQSQQENHFFIKAVHDGYTRLNPPVWHYRSILYVNDNYFIIKDEFEGYNKHQFELNFHLHPETETNRSNGWWQVECRGTVIKLRLIDTLDFMLVCGQTDPIRGWYSPAYNVKEPCDVLTCTKKGNPQKISFKTVIAIL